MKTKNRTLTSLQIAGNARYGGATYLMLEWCKFLIGKNWEVDVLSTDETMIRELQKVAGINIIDSIFIPREIKLITDLHAFVQTVSVFHKKRYDVVHTYTATPSFIGRMAARLAGIPVIVSHQGGWAVKEYSRLLIKLIYTPLEYLGAVASTKTICVSHAEAKLGNKLRIAPKHKLVTIVNGMNPQPFVEATQNGSGKAIRRKLGFSDDHILIGTTCRLVPEKGNEDLIQAMANLKSLLNGVPFTLLFAGDGVDRQKLEDLVRSLALNHHVRFLGFLRDIPTFLAAINIFVFPSLSEGLSISLLEAMAAAKPIVATSILANAELIDHNVSGLLVPEKDPESIAQAVARFSNDPDLANQCAKSARQKALEYYSIDRMFQDTWDLYIELLKQKLPEKVPACVS